MFVKGVGWRFGGHGSGVVGWCSDRVVAGLRTRQGWASVMARKLLLGHASRSEMRPGTADEALAGGRAEVGVDLAGDVTLQAADDLGLGFPFSRAPLDVGAGGRVGAHPGEHDPPQGVVGLAVATGVEPVAGYFP